MSGKDFETSWPLLHHVLLRHLDDELVRFTHHASEQIRFRDVSEDTVRSIIRDGKPVEMFDAFQYPHGEEPFQNSDPVFTFIGEVRGEKMAVALSIRMKKGRSGIEAQFRVVTVITELRGRHTKQ